MNTSAGGLTVPNALVCIFAALIMGLAIAFIYMKSGNYTKSFVMSLVLLPAMVQVVIMMVNGNLGTGVAVLGAFSLVRFRSAPGSSKEICFIFFAMVVGLAAGTGYIGYALFITVIICLAFYILEKTPFGERNMAEKTLKITIPEDLDYTEIFDDIFERYGKKVTLERVKTTNLGSMYELRYYIVLKDVSQEKAMIDEIRCRNGNLTVICGRQETIREEL